MFKKYEKYERVARSFQKFFSQDDLDCVLDRKVDFSIMNEALESKCSREELFRASICIDNLNDRIKHLSTLQNDIALILASTNQNISNSLFEDK